jgi:hypothetical protein
MVDTSILPADAEPKSVARRATKDLTPTQMLSVAIQQKADIEVIRELMRIEKEWHEEQARRSFIAAFSEFKANAPTVVADKTNSHFGNSYSSLANLANTVNKALGPHGLNARWSFSQDKKTGWIDLSCIIEHRDGHSIRETLGGMPVETLNASGKRVNNDMQALKSAVTYLSATTFQAATGIVVEDACLDDDGEATGTMGGQESSAPRPKSGADRKYVTEAQVRLLNLKLSEFDVKPEALLAAFSAESISAIPREMMNNALSWIRKNGKPS